jgi:4-amino-4-deoxy-L-arabinose transferase-like glycosyltransferase
VRGATTTGQGARWAGPIALALAAGCYLHGLGAIDLPSIGDEPLYLQIARVTAASGRWLPLRAESGILDTKPPLLFWLGRLAGGPGGGDGWTLWRLRLPVVLLTFAAAGVAGLVAQRLARSRSAPARR